MNKLFNICLQTTLVILVVKSAYPLNETNGNLLDSYLPACMQALAYYIDLLQYEPVATTTIEPPFYSEREGTTPPYDVSTTTRKSTSWFQSPSWWSSTSTTERPFPTKKHKPGLYAPEIAAQSHGNQAKAENIVLNSSKSSIPTNASNIEARGRTRSHHNQDVLKEDIIKELDKQDQLTEAENIDNFLRSYDDRYGTRNSITDKKRVPPTKPYVEFLLIYDLLKRDAKAANLSKYEGYTDKMVQDLFELSSVSAQRQMYTLLKKMLDRKEIQRSDVVNRVQNLIKELGNGMSVISESLLYYPPLQFIPI